MLLSEYAKEHIIPIIRETRKVLDATTHKRVDCTTQVSDLGAKLARMLGFTLETALEAYGLNGEDMHLWKRVKR
jgi:hypothetical protein